MRVLVLANHYRADHVSAMHPYRPLNPAASSWNTALFAEMSKLDLELHIVQFWPVRRYRRFCDGSVTHHYLPRLPWVDGFTSQVKRWRIARLVRQLKPDLVHGIGAEHGYVWAAAGHGVPSVITIHGYLKIINALAGHASFLKHLFLVREEKCALRCANRVIAINDYMRERFVIEGACRHDRMVVIPNALNPVFLQDWTEGPRPIDIIMVGTLHPLKNLHVALDLFCIQARNHDLRPTVVIVGAETAESAAYHTALLVQRDELGLDNVRFVGRKSPQELFDLYRQSRILLHVSAFEADPTVVSEALACGTLPVVNPVAGLAFRVQHERNGWHLPIADRAAAAALLTRFINAESDRVCLARVGREEVLMQRRPDAVARATRLAYQDLVLNASGAGAKDG